MFPQLYKIKNYGWKQIGIGIGIFCISSSILYRFYLKSKKYSSYSTSDDVMKGIDLTGKYAVITGCNTGIGKETAKQLLTHGCYIIMACRNIEKAQAAANDICQNEKHDKIKIIQCDLSSLKSVNKFVATFKESNIAQIDYLINNAGVLYDIYSETMDKYEIHFGVNYLSHFYLTQSLLPFIQKSKNGRIINLTSKVHSMMPYSLLTNFVTNVVDKNGDKRVITQKWMKQNWNVTSYAMYGFSKALIVLWTRHLHCKYFNKYGIISCCVDPGLIKTDISTKNITNFGWFWYVGEMLRPFIGKTISQGASTTLRCVAMSDDEIVSGRYYADTDLAEHEVGAIAKPNLEIQDKLWRYTKELLKQETTDS